MSLWSLPPPEATVHQAGDGVYHVKEQVGQDSGPGGLTLWHPTVRTLMAALAQHVPVREWAKHQTFARVWQILQPYSWCLDTCVQTDHQWIKVRSQLCTQLQLRTRKFNAEPWQLIVSLIMRAATFYSKGFLLRNMLTMPAGAVRFCVIVGVKKKSDLWPGKERRQIFNRQYSTDIWKYENCWNYCHNSGR